MLTSEVVAPPPGLLGLGGELLLQRHLPDLPPPGASTTVCAATTSTAATASTARAANSGSCPATGTSATSSTTPTIDGQRAAPSVRLPSVINVSR